ncbi:COBRA-like protein 1 [Actinidia eriantha]|uniref:COBRA-like protein 1 n=1 Tax=Actinidia eriantha TaxID=165200 RepID=UPI00258AEC3B|nr:COBRA-like protein 1 [Actinidia eriantha]
MENGPVVVGGRGKGRCGGRAGGGERWWGMWLWWLAVVIGVLGSLWVVVSWCGWKSNYCYDPLDPNGNITVTFDIIHWRDDGYEARVTIQNFYQYRHVDKPGWKLGWTWSRNEVIWSMSGAFATQQGNCSAFMSQIPHSCKKDPVILDLTPDAAPENRSSDCCRGGVIAAWAVDPSNSFSSFNIIVGNLESNSHGFAPLNLTLEAPGPGYTCGQLGDADPTISSVIGGQREEQVLRTWKSTCTYSSYLANKLPVCCVSLSTFYNPTITSCPNCSCGCRAADQTTESCIREGNLVTQKDFSGLTNPDIVKCTHHMCPLRVHWHLKNNYQDHWRVKLTISNYNYRRNYSDWNVLVQHPGFSQSATTYSFNSTLLPAVGITDEVALFWGLDFYNSELLNADEKQLGSVTSDILLEKDSKTFTLSNGWAFPRRIYFNGENCEMPPPDIFPMLPNGSSSRKPSHRHFVLSFLIYLFVKTSACSLQYS